MQILKQSAKWLIFSAFDRIFVFVSNQFVWVDN